MTSWLMIPQENFPANDTAICQVDGPPSLVVSMDRYSSVSGANFSSSGVLNEKRSSYFLAEVKRSTKELYPCSI